MNKNLQRHLNGVFILDKSIGLSSNQILQKVRRLFNAKKAGHTGSLDMLATGVLPICFGEATKFSQFLLDADKVYYVAAKLGQRTTTCDAEGDVIENKQIDHLDLSFIRQTLTQFQGKISQVPSMYSALKHQGRPLYRLARQGIEIERAPRDIFIYDIKLLDWQADKIQLEVHCSKGTYIRNLIDDVGQALNCGAYVLALRRLKSGPYDLSVAKDLNYLEDLFNTEGIQALDRLLLPIDSMLHHLPQVQLTEMQIKLLYYGQTVEVTGNQTELVRLYHDKNNFIGIGEIQANRQLISHRLIAF